MALSKKHIRKPTQLQSEELLASSRIHMRDVAPLEEIQTDREIAAELSREYDRRDSPLHTTQSGALLSVSDAFADIHDGSFDKEAATARLEYLLHNNDDQSIDQMHIAQDLLRNSMELEIDRASYYRQLLVYKAIPLYLLPNNTDISIKQLEQALKVHRRGFLETIRRIDADIAYAQYNGDSDIDALIGVINEAVFLAALTHKNILNRGFIALPSFYWQDQSVSGNKWISSSDETKNELSGFDIQLVSMADTRRIDKVQVKSSHNYDEIKVYEQDIIVLCAADFGDAIGQIGPVSDAPGLQSLHKRFAGVSPEITGSRIERLNELVLQEILRQKMHIAARQPHVTEQHLTHHIQLPTELAAGQ